MRESIFRKKNIDRINSPDQLNDYVKVVTPPVWLILIGVIVLALGFIVWASLGRIDTIISTVAVSNNGQIVCYVGDSDIDRLDGGEEIMIDGEVYSIESIPSKPVSANAIDEYALYKASLSYERFIYEVKCNGSLPDGLYDASIVVEKTSIISFLLD